MPVLAEKTSEAVDVDVEVGDTHGLELVRGAARCAPAQQSSHDEEVSVACYHGQSYAVKLCLQYFPCSVRTQVRTSVWKRSRSRLPSGGEDGLVLALYYHCFVRA